MFSFLRRKPHGPHQAHFARQELSIAVAPEQTLLQAALAAGLPFPHNCRVGSCNTCKCRLLDGKVRQLTDTSYVLDASERQSGAVLACQTRLLGDVSIEVEWSAAASVAATIAGRIAATRALTTDILELTIELQAPLSYTAGQYAQISLPELGIARSYSFCRAAEAAPQTLVHFFVRHQPGGAFTDWLWEGRTGCEVQVQGPFGSFGLAPSSAPLLLIAGGSGLAPIKAILEQALHEGNTRAAVLLFGARTRHDLYALEELQAIAASWAGQFRFVPVLSAEPANSGWSGAVGMVTDQLAARVDNLAAHEAYLCGPPAMVDAAASALRAGGVAEAAIRCDSFVANGQRPVPEGLPTL
ncbi:MAG: 2Fe-2S iron-sulfur cluster binding domain-containing protein [Proteobacteria bacterium]|nr:2Fe-2S iron-sulfur cluster binding domain-containing protein [Pseudomonadota bacterium]